MLAESSHTVALRDLSCLLLKSTNFLNCLPFVTGHVSAPTLPEGKVKEESANSARNDCLMWWIAVWAPRTSCAWCQDQDVQESPPCSFSTGWGRGTVPAHYIDLLWINSFSWCSERVCKCINCFTISTSSSSCCYSLESLLCRPELYLDPGSVACQGKKIKYISKQSNISFITIRISQLGA